MSQESLLPAPASEQPPGLQRLKTRPQFQAVLAGKTLARTAHFALHSGPVGTDLFAGHCLWLGAMVPKRWARRAVTRNTIKRQIYHVSQLYASRLEHAAHLVRLRSAFDPKHFVSATSQALKVAVRAELHKLFISACAATAAVNNGPVGH